LANKWRKIKGIVRNSQVEIRVEAVLVLWYFEDD